MGNDFQLDQAQWDTFQRLVSIPSPTGEEHEILDYVLQRCQQFPGVRIFEQPVRGRMNIIVEKGAVQPQFTIMLYAHVDTVKRKDGWENQYELRRDPANPNRLRGVGAYDDKQGVLIQLDALERADVPDGVKVIAAFGVGEETDSDGVDTLIQWEGMRDVDLIVSPEIATMSRPEKDYPKDVVIGRRGNFKTDVMVTTPGGHAFDANAPDAGDAARELKNHFAGEHARMCKKDAFFGREQLDIRYENTPHSPEAMRASHSKFGLRQWLLPGTSVAEALQWQLDCARRLALEKDWTRLKINYTLVHSGNEKPYEAFLTDTKSAVLQEIVLPAVRDSYDGYAFGAGLSTADSNLLCIPPRSGADGSRPSNIPIVEIAGVGGDPHLGTEWLSEESLVCAMEFYHTLIEDRMRTYLNAHVR